MNDRKVLAEKHSFTKEFIFSIKTHVLSGKRIIKNIKENLTKFTDNREYIQFPVISVSESNLWNKDDNEDNWILTAGKIQNLRLAVRNINGIEIPAGETFSFWKHIGNPNFGKGYVVGREIREGCIVPTIGGGLCQLSNALYDAALKADFQIVERHRHSQVVKGSLAEQNRDATVKWNYVDLRFRSAFPFRIEVELTDNKLIIRYRSTQKNNPLLNKEIRECFKPSPLNDCYSCRNKACFIENSKEKIKNNQVTTYIVDENWKEYENYINSTIKEKDMVLIPFSRSGKIKNQKNSWNIESKNIRTYTFPALQRIFNFRLNKGKNVFELGLKEDEKLTAKLSRMIPIESTHLVISQNLLPFLYKNFDTGGRTYDVLMTRLPIQQLQEELDAAYSHYPDSPTLHDFRASERVIHMENQALQNAKNIITPHSKVANLFTGKSIKLDWFITDKKEKLLLGKKVLFPAPALGRKGAYEIRQLVKELNFPLVIAGKAVEKNDFWAGINVEYTENDLFKDIGLIIYPVYMESNPKIVLKAMELGIPVITTEASGLISDENVIVVPAGDYNQLKQEVVSALINLNLRKD